MLTIGGRRALSPDRAPPASEPAFAPTAPLASRTCASRCTGSPFGLVIVPGVPGAKFSPVITPPVLTVTSAVACCHHGRGFLAGCTDISSPLSLGTALFATARLGRGRAGSPAPS